MSSESVETVYVPLSLLEAFAADVFRGLGVPDADARVCADVLISADRRGIDSHGVNRLKPIYYDRVRLGIQKPVTRIEVVREGPATAVVDGHHGMGQVIAQRSMQMAIDKAREFGLGMVAVRNSTHYGIAGYYALMATAADMVGMTGTNARPSVAPTFGVENMLGTNPLTVGIPTDEPFPFVLDCATSVTQRGKIELYARDGKAAPEGLIIGEDGRSVTDAEAILGQLLDGTAAFVPLGGIGEETGGYKGYGYATVVEVLSAALQGGAFLKMLSGWQGTKRVAYSLGHFFLAVDVTAFTEPAAFKTTAGEIMRRLRASRRMPGQERIFTAGEKEYLAEQNRETEGVPISAGVQAELMAMRDELGLSQYRFPGECPA